MSWLIYLMMFLGLGQQAVNLNRSLNPPQPTMVATMVPHCIWRYDTTNQTWTANQYCTK